ncbi:MAG: hypothetical protein ACOZBW_09590 [Thermodesulfobacteriota bacterium]
MLSTPPLSGAKTVGPDATTPGGVYLCQVSDTVSCGACCGLYNTPNLSRERLARMLDSRTRRFATVPRDIEAIDRFAQDTLGAEDKGRPMKNFHHCPFLGLIGPEKNAVGCLLHPLADGNQGVDWRGLSYYGAFACATYFCPTCHALEPRYKRVVRQAADNWYDYGLMITETGMLANFLDQVEQQAGRTVDAEDIATYPDAASAVRAFLAIKTTWPFADRAAFHPANFFFNQKEYAPPVIDFTALGATQSRWTPVLTALWSNLDGPAALCEAEAFLDRMVHALAAALKP